MSSCRLRNEGSIHRESKQHAAPSSLASELYCPVAMNRTASKSRRAHRLLRWVFRKGNQLLTCQLDREGGHAAYMLSLVPHWDVRQSVIELHQDGAAAFQRHAAIAGQLREQGWILDAYTVA